MNAPILSVIPAASPPPPVEVVMPGFGELVETLLAGVASDPATATQPAPAASPVPAGAVIPQLVLLAVPIDGGLPEAQPTGAPGLVSDHAGPFTAAAGHALVSSEGDQILTLEEVAEANGEPEEAIEEPAEAGHAGPAPAGWPGHPGSAPPFGAQAVPAGSQPTPVAAPSAPVASAPAGLEPAARPVVAAAPAAPAAAPAVAPDPAPAMAPWTVEAIETGPEAASGGTDPAGPLHRPAGRTAAHAPDAAPGPVAATAPEAPARPAPAVAQAPLSSAARRVAEAVERIEQAPPPRSVTLRLDDLDGLRVTVSVRADGIRLAASEPGHEALMSQLERAVAARGFEMAGSPSGEQRRQTDPDSIPFGWPATGGPRRRPAADPSGIRL